MRLARENPARFGHHNEPGSLSGASMSASATSAIRALPTAVERNGFSAARCRDPWHFGLALPFCS